MNHANRQWLLYDGGAPTPRNFTWTPDCPKAMLGVNLLTFEWMDRVYMIYLLFKYIFKIKFSAWENNILQNTIYFKFFFERKRYGEDGTISG